MALKQTLYKVSTFSPLSIWSKRKITCGFLALQWLRWKPIFRALSPSNYSTIPSSYGVNKCARVELGGGTGRLGSSPGSVTSSLHDVGQITCLCFSFLVWKIDNNDTCLTDCFEIIWGNKPCFLNSKTVSIRSHTQLSGGKNHYIDCKTAKFQEVKM